MKRLTIVLVVAVLLSIFGLGVVSSQVSAEDVPVTASPSYPTEAPDVTASNATDVSVSLALLHGNVTDNGGGSIIYRGFEWGLSSGSYSWSWNETGDFKEEEFSRLVNSLPLDTQVYWIAFAANTIGRGNSTEQSFRTLGVLYAPTNFTATQIGPGSINFTWVKGLGAENTVLRVSMDGYPSDYEDGYPIYSGNGTSVVVEGWALTLTTYCVRAWSESGGQYSEDYAEVKIGGDTLYMIAFIGIALFFTWLAWRSRQLLICLVSFFIWVALALWLFFSNASIFDLSEGYVQILAYVFFMISFVPLIWSMNQEIRHEAQGQRWTTYGQPPKDKKVSAADRYRKNLRGRLGR